MALKTKKKVEAEVEAQQEETTTMMNTEEMKVIQQSEEKDTKESADTRRLQLATNVVSKQFNLDPSYSVSKFDDKGKVVKLTLENNEFSLDVTIKDSDRHGMYVD